MKPTVTFPDDKTPDDGMSSEEEQAEPIGDIAELTARVSENAVVPSNQAQEPGSSARVRVFGTKKNKGVGKGCSGSSGPPAPKRKPTSTVSRPPPSDSSSNDESSNEEDAVQATQTITVGSSRGYSYYPGYLFDVPPKKLKTDNLRKKLMISEIKRSETQTEFYERGMVLMGHLKEFLRQVTMSGIIGEASTSQKRNVSDHEYALDNPDNANDDDHADNTQAN